MNPNSIANLNRGGQSIEAMHQALSQAAAGNGEEIDSEEERGDAEGDERTDYERSSASSETSESAGSSAENSSNGMSDRSEKDYEDWEEWEEWEKWVWGVKRGNGYLRKLGMDRWIVQGWDERRDNFSVCPYTTPRVIWGRS